MTDPVDTTEQPNAPTSSPATGYAPAVQPPTEPFPSTPADGAGHDTVGSAPVSMAEAPVLTGVGGTAAAADVTASQALSDAGRVASNLASAALSAVNKPADAASAPPPGPPTGGDADVMSPEEERQILTDLHAIELHALTMGGETGVDIRNRVCRVRLALTGSSEHPL